MKPLHPESMHPAELRASRGRRPGRTPSARRWPSVLVATLVVASIAAALVSTPGW